MDDIAILIPALDPDEKLVAFVREIRALFAHVVVVDDGSSSGADAFSAIRPLANAVLVHERNFGKGAALRTGFAWILENLPDVAGVVTADADGQHLPRDVARVADALRGHPGGLVLGARSFSGSVPFRSRFGNWWARTFFKMLTGLAILDTQTGLRGVPRDILPRMLEIPGSRYEYEMEMLVQCQTFPAPPLQIPIETVYLDENRSSHFHPLRDTFRTQYVVFRWKAMRMFGPRR